MKLQKHIKEIIITISVISITAVTYAALSTVTNGDPLTATGWNNMVSLVNTLETKLTNISSNGASVGIGTASPSQKLDVNGGIVSRGTAFIGDGTSSDIRKVTASTDLNFRNSAGTVEMTLNSGGNLGIGTSSPQNKLDVKGGTRIYDANGGYLYFGPSDGALEIGSGNDHYSFIDFKGDSTLANDFDGRLGYSDISKKFDMNKSLDVSGVVTQTSDIRLKTNIKKLDKSLEKILTLSGVTFNRRDSGKESIGVIAQEVEKVFPEFISKNNEGYKTVNYSAIVAPLIESVKELKKENEELKKRVEMLENK